MKLKTKTDKHKKREKRKKSKPNTSAPQPLRSQHDLNRLSQYQRYSVVLSSAFMRKCKCLSLYHLKEGYESESSLPLSSQIKYGLSSSDLSNFQQSGYCFNIDIEFKLLMSLTLFCKIEKNHSLIGEIKPENRSMN